MDVYIYMGYNKGTVKETDRPPAGKGNDMKKRIDIYGSIPEDMVWNDNQAVVVHENGWFKADMTCTTKSVKVALNRFFKAVPELASWRETFEVDGDYWFKGNDFIMGDGSRNEEPSYCWEIDCTNAAEDFPSIYIFLNINEAARGGLD